MLQTLRATKPALDGARTEVSSNLLLSALPLPWKRTNAFYLSDYFSDESEH